jgi:hypothetical protein
LFQAGLKAYRARMEEKEKKGESVLGAMALQEMASSLGAAATSIPSKRIRVDDLIHRDPPPRSTPPIMRGSIPKKVLKKTIKSETGVSGFYHGKCCFGFALWFDFARDAGFSE